MELILIRHAIAETRDRARWPDDDLRPLTSAGKRRFRKAATGLVRWVPKVDLLLTSPLVRAQQTATILFRTGSWPEAIVSETLRPDADPRHLFPELRRTGAKCIALVGHEPHLSSLIASCIGPRVRADTLRMKKGGATCLTFGRQPAAGKGTLVWIAPPGLLRSLR